MIRLRLDRRTGQVLVRWDALYSRFVHLLVHVHLELIWRRIVFRCVCLWVSMWVCASKEILNTRVALQPKTGRDRLRELHLWLVERRDQSWFWRPVLDLQRGPDVKNQWREFHPMLVTDLLGFVDVPVRFCSQRVKDQGRGTQQPEKPSEYNIL